MAELLQGQGYLLICTLAVLLLANGVVWFFIVRRVVMDQMEFRDCPGQPATLD